MLSTIEPEPYVTCQGERFRLYLDRHTIQRRVDELARQISQDHEGQRPILIGVLNGAYVFIADLMRALTIDCEVDFLKLSSYGAAKVSSGAVRELKQIDAQIKGRHVIIVEDIIDTGLSMRFILDRLQVYEPASLKVATLLHKFEATQAEIPIDYVGFRIKNLFVIGYGLDFGQLARNLSDIYILDDGQEPGTNGAL